MMTIQQASIAVGRQMGLPADFDGSVDAINALGADDKLNFTAALGAYIRANQDQFTPGQVATANTMPQSFGQLQDSSFSVGDFLSATASNADTLIVKPLVNVGQSASALANAVPAILILIGAILLFTWTKKTQANITAS